MIRYALLTSFGGRSRSRCERALIRTRFLNRRFLDLVARSVSVASLLLLQPAEPQELQPLAVRQQLSGDLIQILMAALTVGGLDVAF